MYTKGKVNISRKDVSFNWKLEVATINELEVISLLVFC